MNEVAEPSTLINVRDKRALPAVNKCVCPCLYGSQESKSNECFRPRIVWFFLYLPVSFYISIGNLGTIWAPKWQKNNVLISTLMSEKACICNGFYSSSLLDNKKQILFFILKLLLCLENQSDDRAEHDHKREKRRICNIHGLTPFDGATSTV